MHKQNDIAKKNSRHIISVWLLFVSQECDALLSFKVQPNFYVYFPNIAFLFVRRPQLEASIHVTHR